MRYVFLGNNHSKTNLDFYVSKIQGTLLPFVLIILSSCGGPPQNLDSSSETPAQIGISADTVVDFPDIVTGLTYQPVITIENFSITVPADNITLTSSLNQPFEFAGGIFPGTGGNCSNSLAPGATCTIQIVITPIATGSFNSTLSFDYFDGLSNQTFTSILTAQARDPLPAILAITPAAAHDFGVIAIGGFDELPIVLTNSGEQAATTMNFTGITNPYSILNNTCGVTLAPLAQCSFTVRFTPIVQAVVNQTLNLSYNDGVAPQSLTKNFSGEGRVAGFLTIDEGLLFDYQIINNGFNSNRTLTVRNTGGGNATSITFSSVLAPYSIVSNDCPVTLVPTANCTVIVRFTPTSTNTFNETLDIDFYDGFNNQTTAPDFTGQGFATLPLLSLISPVSSPSNQNNPTIRVSSLINNIRVRLYRNAGCGTQVGNQLSAGTTLDFALVMAEGTYQFHARLEDSDGNLGVCSASLIDYEYDNTNPNRPSNVTFASTYTSSSTTSPSVSWNASSSTDVVDYQVGISTSAAGGNSSGGWTSKGNVLSATQSGLSMTECQYYYASVQSIDDVGLVSTTHSVSALSYRYDSAIPTAPSALNEDGDASSNNSATVSWNASSDTCGVDHYEVAISEDLNANNTLDASEIGNVVAYTNVGLILTHRFNSLALTNGVVHFTSVRAMDTTNRYSSAAVSDSWIVYDPSIELPNMIVWLDGNDPSSILDNNGNNALSGAFNGVVNNWLDKSGSPVTHNFNALNGTARPSYDPLNFSVDFDGVNSVMTTSNHSEINTATVTQRNITLSFETSADTVSRQVLYEEGGNIRGMNIYIFNNQLYCGFYNDPTPAGGNNDGDDDQPFIWVNTPISTNTVYFVTWVFDYTNFTGKDGPDGSLDCYLDSTNFGSIPTTSRLFAHSGAVGLGEVNGQSVFEDGSVPASGHNFLGSIYEVMLFNNAPNAAAVTNVHTYLDNKWN